VGSTEAEITQGGRVVARAVGTHAVFVPARLGVREGPLTLLHAPIVPTPWPIALALAARLWLLLGETAAFAAAALVGVTTEESGGTKDA
jgi:hypothetical protein